MFQLSVITDELSQDPDVVLQFVQDYHLNGIELRSLWEKNPFEYEEADILRIHQAAQKAGIRIPAVAAPFFKCSFQDENAIAEHLEGLRRCCRYAHILGAEIIRGFSFWRDENITLEQIAEKYRKLVLPILEEEDMRIALEPEPSVNTPNGKTLAELLRLIDSDRVGAVWDPGNIIYEDSGERPYPEGYEAVKPWLLHVHLKDAVRENGKGRAVPVGTGMVDMEGQFKRLAADGYTGWVSLEPHYRLDRELDEKTLQLPGGTAFSDGGLAAGVDTITRFYKLLTEWNLTDSD